MGAILFHCHAYVLYNKLTIYYEYIY